MIVSVREFKAKLSRYLKLARGVLDSARQLREGIAAVPGLKLLGAPKLSVFAFSSDTLDVYALGDAMEARGWKLDRQMMPPANRVLPTTTLPSTTLPAPAPSWLGQ